MFSTGKDECPAPVPSLVSPGALLASHTLATQQAPLTPLRLKPHRLWEQPRFVTTTSQELLLQQSSLILIKSRCSLKTTVATKIPRTSPPAKSRAPERSKDFHKKTPNPLGSNRVGLQKQKNAFDTDPYVMKRNDPLSLIAQKGTTQLNKPNSSAYTQRRGLHLHKQLLAHWWIEK